MSLIAQYYFIYMGKLRHRGDCSVHNFIYQAKTEKNALDFQSIALGYTLFTLM